LDVLLEGQALRDAGQFQAGDPTPMGGGPGGLELPSVFRLTRVWSHAANFRSA
jgi:hypothetical protein